MYVHSNDRCQRTAIPDGAFAEQVSSEGAGKELDKVRKEKMLIIRQEEDAAQLSADLTDDAQAQSRTLQDELDVLSTQLARQLPISRGSVGSGSSPRLTSNPIP